MDFNSETLQKETNVAKNENSNWLKDLGEQSWQAELVISGLVITGLFQMPDLFIKWVETAIIQSGEIEYTFLNLASIFFLIGIDCLIIFFGIHLLFRGIWIALLGLNSVYPNGIDVLSKNGMGEKYWQKAKEKYPNLTAYNIELDANCSLLFSLATVTIIIISSITITILVFYQCIRFLTSIYPNIANHIMPIGIGAYLIFLLVSLTTQYLGKKYPDNKTIEKIINGYGIATGILFSLYVFRKPIGYINSIYSSNVKSKYLWLIIMLISGLMGFMGARQMGKSNIFYDFEVEKYFVFNNKPHQLWAFNYENLINKETPIYTPIIQSDIIADDFVKVFIPTIAREEERMNLKEYSFIERFKMKNAQREARDKEKLEVYKQFNRIYINDTLQVNLEYQFYTHPQATERGLLVYIPSENCLKGRNILEIRKNYFSKDSIQKIVKIPFFFKKG
jgi:hypothetical protein